MNSEKWQHVKEVFDAVLRHQTDERRPFLDKACDGDNELRSEVESLLASFDESFLEKPAVGEVADIIVSQTGKALKTGQVIGQYRIIAELGKGGQGAVYKAFDSKLNRTVALKTLPPDLTIDESARKRFEREAQLASALDHPNICTIHDLTHADGTHFIVMQFVDGKNVRQLVDGKPLELKGALKIAIQVCDALATAHHESIIHRDIKAQNIIVTGKGHVKILDFGLAKLTDENVDQTELTAIGSPYGTPTYAAPEQSRGEKVDHRADIFSTGVLLYEMLTGTWAFHGKTAVDVRHAVLHDEPKPVSERRGEEIPERLDAIVSKALAKGPANRFQQISEMRDQLIEVLRELPAGENSDTANFLDNFRTMAPSHFGTFRYRTRLFTTLVLVFVVAGAALGYFAYRLFQNTQAHPTPVSRTLTQMTFGAGLQSEPTWSPDGRFVAYSADKGGNLDIWVQQVSGGNPVQVTRSPAPDWQPDWSPDGNNLVFRSEREGGGLFIVPALGGNERKIAPFGFQPRWSLDAALILFYNSNLQNVTAPPKIYIVDMKGNSAREVLADIGGEFPGRLRAAWHPDGRRISLWGYHRQHGLSFWTVSLEGGEPIRSEFSPQVAQQIKEAAVDLFDFRWAKDARTIYFEGVSKGVRNLWKVETDPHTSNWTSGLERLTTGAGFDRDITLSPDGKKLAFSTMTEKTRLWSLPFNAQTGRVSGAGQPVTPPGLNALGHDLSRDGKKLAFIMQRAEKREIWERSFAEGSEKLLATAEDFVPTAPRWSRDAARLAFARNSVPSPERSQQYTFNFEHSIALLNPDGGEQILTSSNSSQGWAWDWSADGLNILGSSARQTSGNWGLYLFPVASAPHAEDQARLITSNPEYDAFNARFSPDERWICFIGIKKTNIGDAAIYVVPVEGGEWTRITEGNFYSDKPRWSPDGRILYFLSNRSGFFNVWGIRFDPKIGKPSGEAFRITNFDDPVHLIPSNMTEIELAVGAERLIVPTMDVSGNVWILDNVDR